MTLSSTLVPVDPTLEVAERQLEMLGELARMAMIVSRGYAAAAAASAHAVEVILADEFWQPETGRARALAGAKDAADAFQKVSRTVRLTLVLEKTAAEWVRDLRAGVVSIIPSKDVGETPADHAELPEREGRSRPPSRDPAGSPSADRDRDRGSCVSDTERLVEFDRPDVLPRAPFRETVDTLAADLGVTVDWEEWEISGFELGARSSDPKPGPSPHPPCCGGGGGTPTRATGPQAAADQAGGYHSAQTATRHC